MKFKAEEMGYCVHGCIPGALHNAWHTEQLCGQGRVARARSLRYPVSNMAPPLLSTSWYSHLCLVL